MQTKAIHHRKDNTRLSGTMWLLTDHFTYRDFSYDALDANEPAAATNTSNLGKFSAANQSASWNVLNMPANPKAASVRVLFNFFQYNSAKTLNVTVNGRAHPTPWPYPDSQGYTCVPLP